MKIKILSLVVLAFLLISQSLWASHENITSPCIYLALGQNIDSIDLLHYIDNSNITTSDLFYELKIVDKNGDDISSLRSDDASKSYVIEQCTQKLSDLDKTKIEYILVLDEVETDLIKAESYARDIEIEDDAVEDMAKGIAPQALPVEKTSTNKLGATVAKPSEYFGVADISSWPWWSAPLILGALGAIFMAVFAFYAPYRQQQVDNIVLSETRMKILNQLEEVDRIPTDISTRVKKSKSTTVEHLNALCDQGLVHRVATPGKKFVFYSLTQSGRILLLRKKSKSSLAQ